MEWDPMMPSVHVVVIAVSKRRCFYRRCQVGQAASKRAAKPAASVK